MQQSKEHLLRIEETRFLKTVLNYSPKGKKKKERGQPARVWKIYEAGKGNNDQTKKAKMRKMLQ